mmetsp:Transcript_5496/g.6344  ORF Transcript_5496/g.6344 Transcript_5496/m.6344 type:complete len:81 (-) Transcript_5496:1045-1287(-)
MLDVTNFFDSLTHDDEFLERVLKERGLLFKGYKKDELDLGEDNVKKARRKLFFFIDRMPRLVVVRLIVLLLCRWRKSQCC